MKLFSNEYNLICQKDLGKEINFQVNNKTHKLVDCPCIINHKNKIKTKRLKEINKGIDLIHVNKSSSQNISDSLDINACKLGLSIYQQFNENSNSIESYLYGFDKKDIPSLNKQLKQLKIDYKIEIKNNFVLLDKNISTPLDQYPQIFQKRIDNSNFNKILSFWLGVNLAYGHLDISKSTLKSTKIHLPVKGHTTKLLKPIQKIIDFLDKNIIFIKSKQLQENYGLTYQIIIKDYNILNFFIKHYPQYKISNTLTLNKARKIKYKLIKYITNQPFKNKTDIIHQINKYNIKIQTT